MSRGPSTLTDERHLMSTKVLSVMIGVGMLGSAAGLGAQLTDRTQATVKVVQTIGCAAQEGSMWFLTNATEPVETDSPGPAQTEIEEGHNSELGSLRFQLIGVADFVDPGTTLNLGQRSRFLTAEQVNATGQLADGHKMFVKGLHITDSVPQRINVTSAISLSDACG